MATPPMLDGHPAVPGPAERPDPVATVAVILLGVSVVGLALGGILAIYDWRTPAAERPLFWVVLGTFVAAVAVLLAGAAVRWARTAPR